MTVRGDQTSNQDSCHPDLRSASGNCPESIGPLQVRYLYHLEALSRPLIDPSADPRVGSVRSVDPVRWFTTASETVISAKPANHSATPSVALGRTRPSTVPNRTASGTYAAFQRSNTPDSTGVVSRQRTRSFA